MSPKAVFTERDRQLLEAIDNNLKLVLKQGEQIMETQKELASRLKAATDTLVAVGVGVEKIGKETTALQADVKTLKDIVAAGPQLDPALVDAVNAVEEQTNKVAGQVKVVDDLVPDAP